MQCINGASSSHLTRATGDEERARRAGAMSSEVLGDLLGVSQQASGQAEFALNTQVLPPRCFSISMLETKPDPGDPEC